MQIEITIKSWMGKVLFEYEKEENTIKETLMEALKSDADLRDAVLHGADLHGADLKTIKADLWDVLLKAIPEIPNLKKSLVEGKVDGSTYDGECSCLCGTLEKSDNKKLSKIIFDQRDSSRPIERLFFGIKKGDTPETNPVSKIVMEWICEFEGYINAGVPS